MKEIKAVIQPSKLYAVLMALRDITAMPGFIVTDARGFPRGHPDARSQSHGIDALDNFELTRIECIVSDNLVPLVVEAISRAAHTGNPGDGKIVVSDIVDIIQIRTGLHGEEAI